ncbi:hypothetical protein [Nostoc sp. CMAA1605]|uniref:hypothetical protein n=1 Tax=Nostoc sp. CMAA1605 TaxID=2055159 RepID=UPI001F1B67B9|nr:hypothetical protein [Nostoc sp. CMAA1605]
MMRFSICFEVGDWGLGIGDWGLGDKGDKGDFTLMSCLFNAQFPMPHAQFPIP